MKGVFFDKHHTDDYGLTLSKKEIGSPVPKLETIDLPGADGLLDMTDYFGSVKYKNRKLKFELSTPLKGHKLLKLYSAVQNDLSGNRFDSIIIDDDSDYKYTGRVTSVKLSEGVISKFIIECDCEPYKTGVNDIVESVTLSALPYASNYGDPNNDGVTDNLDVVYMMKLIKSIDDGETVTAQHLGSCDLNFDGLINEDDVLFINQFLSQSKYSNIRDYAEHRNIERDTDFEMNFGGKVAEISIIVDLTDYADYGQGIVWELYVDGAMYFRSNVRERTVLLSGNHNLTIRSIRSGTAVISYPKSKL